MRPSDDQYRDAAIELVNGEIDIEVDNNAEVSRSDDEDAGGAFVQAWIWITDDEAYGYR